LTIGSTREYHSFTQQNIVIQQFSAHKVRHFRVFVHLSTNAVSDKFVTTENPADLAACCISPAIRLHLSPALLFSIAMSSIRDVHPSNAACVHRFSRLRTVIAESPQ
jgi:hypothetical protein